MVFVHCDLGHALHWVAAQGFQLDGYFLRLPVRRSRYPAARLVSFGPSTQVYSRPIISDDTRCKKCFRFLSGLDTGT
jgi:hypothetical protein